jgi:hypothetical protein
MLLFGHRALAVASELDRELLGLQDCDGPVQA